MKRTLIYFFLVALLAAGVASVVLFKQLKTARQHERAAAEAAQAEAALRSANEERLNEAERERARMEKQNLQLAEVAKNLRQSEAKQASNFAALAQQVKTTGANSAAPAAETPDGKGMGDMFQKMMKDPAMKEMVRNQQKAMMKTMYGSLFKELNLPAEQQKQFTELLLDSQMSGMDSAAGLFGGDGASRTNAIQAISEKNQATTREIKALLGDEKFAQY